MTDHRMGIDTPDGFAARLRDVLDERSDDIAGAVSADLVARRIAARSFAAGRQPLRHWSTVMAAIIGLALLAATLGVMTVLSTPPPRPEVANGPISFRFEAMDPLTGERVHPCICGDETSWSADGSRATMLRYKDVMLVEALNGEQRMLFQCESCKSHTDPSRATITPDGTGVTYSEDGQISIFDIADGRSHQVTTLPVGQVALDPAMSPDGRRIAFTMAGIPGVWLVDRDGSDMRQMAPPPEDAKLGDGAMLTAHGSPMRDQDRAARPAWSPDGSQIAFLATPPYGDPATGTITPQLWMLDVARDSATLLFESPGCCGHGIWPDFVWSPDGRDVAFSVAQLWYVDAATGEARLAPPGRSGSLAWRPVPPEAGAS